MSDDADSQSHGDAGRRAAHLDAINTLETIERAILILECEASKVRATIKALQVRATRE